MLGNAWPTGPSIMQIVIPPVVEATYDYVIPT